MLQNVIWTSDSTYSLVIDEAYVPQGYQRTYKFQTSKISPENPLKITLAWTGEPWCSVKDSWQNLPFTFAFLGPPVTTRFGETHSLRTDFLVFLRSARDTTGQ